MKRSVKMKNKIITMLLMVLCLSVTATAPAAMLSQNAAVLVNSTSPDYDDFTELIQPYLGNFGVPYDVIDISAETVDADIADYAVIIIGHNQLDIGNVYMSTQEQANITAAVNTGTGLVNFDSDLAVGTPSGCTDLTINCADNANQDPVVTIGTLDGGDNQWGEYQGSRPFPTVFAHTQENPPVMRFYESGICNGEYEVYGLLYTGWAGCDYYYGFSAASPNQYSVYTLPTDPGQNDQHTEYYLGSVQITDGNFEMFAQDGDYDAPHEYYYGWAKIRLHPLPDTSNSQGRYDFINDIFDFVYTPPAIATDITFSSLSHYVTNRHVSQETISTNDMNVAGFALPAGVDELATSASKTFLAATQYGQGNAVQFASYEWMTHAVKGPVYGLDDLVWKSIVYTARKPFLIQAMPPFLTMRVDDSSGQLWWAQIATDEFDFKPWTGVFLDEYDVAESQLLSTMVNAGKMTTSVHSLKYGTSNSTPSWKDVFYFDRHNRADWSDSTIAANFAQGTAWHNTYNIPISKMVVPHFYEIGTNVFDGLSSWGVEFIITQQPIGKPYDTINPWTSEQIYWLNAGPYRLYETDRCNTTTPVFYADYVQIPGHPEFDGQFFNCVTEIRDDAGYEWYPDNNVTNSVGRGTRQSKRAFDSMVLATLVTHEQFIDPAISQNNWRAILTGITNNLATYNPIYVTLDYASQYVRAMYNSQISDVTYDNVTHQATVSLSGSTDMPTMLYLFTDDSGQINETFIDVPQFSGSANVDFTEHATYLDADINRDGNVNMIDYSIFAQNFAGNIYDQTWYHGADSDKNGTVEAGDLNNITNDWLNNN